LNIVDCSQPTVIEGVTVNYQTLVSPNQDFLVFAVCSSLLLTVSTTYEVVSITLLAPICNIVKSEGIDVLRP
jgi:hypothetical protein